MPREQLWLTSKVRCSFSFEVPVCRALLQPGDSHHDLIQLWNNSHSPERVELALNETLKNLGVSYLDLYLIQ